MSVEVTAKQVTPHDNTLTLTGSPQQLVAANQYRTHLQFQNTGTHTMYYSYTNANCGAGLTGCYQLAAGANWSPTFGLPATAVYVNGTAGDIMVCTEC